MSESLRAEVDQLYWSLIGAFGATKEDLPDHRTGCEAATDRVVHALAEGPEWDDELVDRCLSVIVLLGHLGMRESAVRLLFACERSSTPVALARFIGVRVRWGALFPSIAMDELPADVAARLGANFVLSGRYQGEAPTSYLQDPVFAGGSVAHFALTSLAFDNAVFAARLSDARVALGRLEQLAAAIMTDLGEDHPYLGLVLLTLSSAKCALAAVEGNMQDLRRHADVLAVAVQRASAQLGPEHAQTLGGMANLAHSEFEIALASRSPREVMQCVENLAWLEDHAARLLGSRHPTVVILAMNAAVARLESARQDRSVELIADAETRLLEVAGMCEERFGAFHPCTAIARSNAASAGFDVARARRSRPELEHMVTVLEDTVSQVSNSLGAGHATARALTRQLRACHRLLAGEALEGVGGGIGTIVRTAVDEMWSLDDNYVPVYDTSPPARRRRRGDPIGVTEQFDAGDIVEGVVAMVGADEVLVDINDRLRGGVIPAGELSARGEVSVGDTVEAMVMETRDARGRVVLSMKQAEHQRVWSTIEALKEGDEPVRGTVVEVVKGGLIVDIGLRAFLPALLVELDPVRDLQTYVGRELVAKIIELDKNRYNVVLSRRTLLEQGRSREHAEFLARLRPGEHRTCVVTTVANFGVFVDLGGVEEHVPISELSWKHINHPSEVVEVGQEVTVEVLGVDRLDGFVFLSLKAAQDDLWRRFADRHTIGDVVAGEVIKLVSFGVFVRVAEGIEGLVHIAELAEEPVEIPEEVVRAGDRLQVKIIDLDLERRRVSLSMKQAGTELSRTPLSERERAVLRLLVRGSTQAEVATALGIPRSATARLVAEVSRKLGLRDLRP